MAKGMVALLTLLLAACAAAPPATFGPRGHAEFARELAGPQTYLGQMPVAMVLMKGAADDLDRPRKLAFCQAYLGKLKTPAEIEAQSSVAQNLVLTRWLVDNDTLGAAQAQDCGYLVDHYDYARAAKILAAVTPSQGDFTGAGPYLLIVDGNSIAAEDGSFYTSRGDFESFIGSWNSALDAGERQATQEAIADSRNNGSIWTRFAHSIVALLETFFPHTRPIIGVIRDAVC